MAIHNMLHKQDKRYTVIVVVVDYHLEKKDLPLELQTLSPILISERFYENRLSSAFYGKAIFC